MREVYAAWKNYFMAFDCSSSDRLSLPADNTKKVRPFRKKTVLCVSFAVLLFSFIFITITNFNVQVGTAVVRSGMFWDLDWRELTGAR